MIIYYYWIILLDYCNNTCLELGTQMWNSLHYDSQLFVMFLRSVNVIILRSGFHYKPLMLCGDEHHGKFIMTQNYIIHRCELHGVIIFM